MLDCPVCDGRRVIRLPYRRPVKVVHLPEDSWSPDEDPGYRIYDCPECVVDKVSFNRLQALNVQSMFDYLKLYDPAPFLDDFKHRAAHQMVDKLVESGHIRFEMIPADEFHGPGMKARLDVVHPDLLVSFEERVNERQMELATELYSQTLADVRNWGSHYGNDTVGKTQVVDWMAGCLRRIRERFTKPKG